MSANTIRRTLLALCLLLWSAQIFAWEFDRRTPQFRDEFSYAIFPAPYNIPGIGKGVAIGAGLINIGGSYVDTYGLAITGDVEGNAIGISDIHLISKRLILDIGASRISKAGFGINNSRGMEGDEDPDEFNTAHLTDSVFYGGQLILTFAERRLEFAYQRYTTQARIESIVDSDGKLIAEIDDPMSDEEIIANGSVTLDLTDDRNDPRNGFRVKWSRNFPQNVKEENVEFYTVDVNATAFIPVLTNSTWLFNYFQSDAVVLRQGETDRNKVGNDFTCATGDSVCDSEKDKAKDQIIAQNTYGSASTLGGNSRLRSFINTRFHGAHTRFYGTEFRWNLTDEKERFNIFFMEDLRTAIQIAFFYEYGSVADKEEDLFKETRHSTGIGIRAVMGSGLVYRLDYSVGEEGAETILFFGYPWDIL
ncbi:MAG: hypothetical protein COB67_08470 [SAR324 cluster bacterium]|uniref:Bacterial surface antigen (D15) domain-containing protein n=1 Tax=SAR324 cluster bacterium TaxID=2024889 RepID=A0A2A4T2E3_9DELT|nr:MAG: hypothetical protein COB67_08470 [SAR324 cluster bacterium]